MTWIVPKPEDAFMQGVTGYTLSEDGKSLIFETEEEAAAAEQQITANSNFDGFFTLRWALPTQIIVAVVGAFSAGAVALFSHSPVVFEKTISALMALIITIIPSGIF